MMEQIGQKVVQAHPATGDDRPAASCTKIQFAGRWAPIRRWLCHPECSLLDNKVRCHSNLDLELGVQPGTQNGNGQLPPLQGQQTPNAHPTSSMPDESIPKVESHEEAGKLEPGTHFMAGDGKRRMKPIVHRSAAKNKKDLPKPQSLREAAALERGSHFMDPNGIRRVRP